MKSECFPFHMITLLCRSWKQRSFALQLTNSFLSEPFIFFNESAFIDFFFLLFLVIRILKNFWKFSCEIVAYNLGLYQHYSASLFSVKWRICRSLKSFAVQDSYIHINFPPYSNKKFAEGSHQFRGLACELYQVFSLLSSIFLLGRQF